MITVLWIGVILLIVWRIYVLKNRKKDISRTKNVAVSPFNSQECIIIKALIEHYEKGGLENQEIHELLGITHKTSENQRKIKNEFIKSLNAKLMVVCRINEGIIRTPTDLDKRFFKHQLNKEALDVLKGDFCRENENMKNKLVKSYILPLCFIRTHKNQTFQTLILNKKNP